MRVFCGILSLLMILFIGVQYNDPDGAIWMLFYGIPALWAALAALAPRLLLKVQALWLLLASIGAALIGVFYYWPRTPQWWAKEVWYETETAREGMGMMIVLIVLLLVWLTRAVLNKRRTSNPHNPVGDSA